MVHVVTMAFCPSAHLNRMMPVWRDKLWPFVKHHVAFRNYPEEGNLERMRATCYAYGSLFSEAVAHIDGAHQAQTAFINQLNLADDDVFILLDQDAVPGTKNFHLNLAQYALKHGGWIAAWDWDAERQFNSLIRNPTEPKLYRQTVAVQVSISAMTGKTWRAIGSEFVSEDPRLGYGFIEMPTRERLRAKGMEIWHARDVIELPSMTDDLDPDYLRWKKLHAHERSFLGTFAEYKASLRVF